MNFKVASHPSVCHPFAYALQNHFKPFESFNRHKYHKVITFITPHFFMTFDAMVGICSS
jgi:hypothetical protein